MKIDNNIKIIISTDDFGISPLANERMLNLISQKKIDRISVMMSGEISDQEAEALLKSGVKMDIHLDLLGEIDKNRKLTNDALTKKLALVAFNFLFGKFKPSIIQKKWETQIEKFKNKFDRYPDGINSHEHVHFFPVYFKKIVLNLAEKYQIKYIRLGQKTSYNYNSTAFILNFFRKANWLFFSKQIKQFDMSDLLISLDWVDNFDIKKEVGKLKQDIIETENKAGSDVKTTTLELVVHPERDEENLFLENF